MRSLFALKTCAPRQALSCRFLQVWWIVGFALTSATLTGRDVLELRETPLTERLSGAGRTLFTPLSPELSGMQVENRYSDPRMWGDRFQEFKFGAIGTGVTIGDYDADGRPDVFVVSKTEVSRLFRNLGGWKFEDVTEKAGLLPSSGLLDRGLAWFRRTTGSEEKSGPVGWTQGAAFADVNNDGRLDLYVCRFGAPNLLYINRGDGTFSEEAAQRGVAVTDASGMAAFCDFDRDGWLDFYLQTNLLNVTAQPRGQPDFLFRNKGDGTFENVTERAGIRGETQGHSVVWWDYDQDGWPDLYVANDFAEPDRLYRNNRDGTFTDALGAVVPYTPHSSMGSDLGDVNNDGRIDLLVADMAATTREKDHRGMARTRALLNTMEPEGEQPPQYMRNMLFVNTGLGHMLEAAHLAGITATDWTWTVMLQDFDNDGWLDVFFTNGMVRELHNSDLVRRISASESMDESVRVEKASPVLAETNLAYRNRGDLSFEPAGAAWGLNEHGVSFGAAAADFDGDGDLDLIHANYERGPTLLRNDGRDGNRAVFQLHGTRSNRFGVGARVEVETESGRQVRELVLARGYLSSGEPILHFGLGDDPVIRRAVVLWPSGHRQEFANLPANHRFDITEPEAPIAPSVHSKAPSTPLFLRSEKAPAGLRFEEDRLPASVRQPLSPFRFDRQGPALAAADLDGDGRDDLVVGGTAREAGRIVLSKDAGFITHGLLPREPGATDDGPLLVFDANGDGRPDLLVTRSGDAVAHGENSGRATDAFVRAYRPQLLLNTSGAEFRPSTQDLSALAVSAGAVAEADVDGDGDRDVFLGGRLVPGRYPQVPRSFLLLNTGGVFEDATERLGLPASPGLVTGACFADVNADGRVDLVVTCEWGLVRCFLNGPRGFAEATTELGFDVAGKGLWSGIVAADINGDGRPDFVLGNLGLNTPYRASSERPLTVLYGDFARNGTRLLIETEWDGDRLFPRRTRNELAEKIPLINRRYPNADAFARATLEEVFGRETIGQAERFDAHELRTGLLLSGGGGRYDFKPLPHLVQLGPAESLAVDDFNQDGKPDLCVVQNRHDPIPSLGRFAGGAGVVLLGDGRGDFLALTPVESGFMVLGDGKSVVTMDLDGEGRRDLVVTRNGGPSLVFLNQGAAGMPATVARGARSGGDSQP